MTTPAIRPRPLAFFRSPLFRSLRFRPTIRRQPRNWRLAFPLGLVLPISALLIWEAASALGWITAHLLPPPSALLRTLISLAQDGSLAAHIGVSSARVLTGFVIGVSCGLALGALVALNRRVNGLIDPSLQALRAVPSLAWVPLLLLWLFKFLNARTKGIKVKEGIFSMIDSHSTTSIGRLEALVTDCWNLVVDVGL